MERTRALLAGFLLAAGLAGGARAAGPQLAVGAPRALPGGVVEVPVEIRGGEEIGALHLELAFDAAVLEAVSIAQGPAVPGDAMFDTNLATSGRAIAGFAGMSPVALDGLLATVKLRLTGRAEAAVPLVLEKVEAWAADDQRALEVATADGLLPVGARKPRLGLVVGALAAVLVVLVLLAVLFASRRRSREGPAPRRGCRTSRPPAAPFPPSPVRPPAAERPPDPTVLSAGPAARFLTGRQPGRVVPLSARTRAGRDPDCEIVLDDPRISRIHFSLEHGPSGWALSDHGSGNGTFVNGYRVSVPVLVGEGDEIAAGETRLRLEGLGPFVAGSSAVPAAGGGPVAPAFCSQCGQRLAGDARFCSRCGRPVA